MDIVFKDDQVNQISKYLKITKITVSNVLTMYVNYLKGKLSEGETVKFLNVCYLRVAGKDESTHETLAYISHELANDLGLSQVIVNRVLTTYEEFLIKDLKRLYKYSIRGLVRIRLERNHKGEYRVRIKKSTVYNGQDIYISTTGYFKRKVEFSD